jgi:hypothetical protein
MSADDREDQFRQEDFLARTEPTHSEDGVDLTLIRWMLSLSPAERLEALQGTMRSIERLRREPRET